MASPKLKNLFRLSHKVTLYVPTKDRSGQELPQELVTRMEERVARDFSRVNGGATSTDGIGYWIMPDQVIREKVRLVFSYADNLEAAIDAAIELAEWIKLEAQQDAVSIEIDQELYIL